MNKSNYLGKPINTCLSAGTDIESKFIAKAKNYIGKNFHNRYNLLPHLTYTICPFPEYNLGKIKKEIDSYFNGHVSAKGNHLIADGFHIFLKNNNLLN